MNGFLREVTGRLEGVPDAGITNIMPIMEAIEIQIKGLSKAEQRLPMLALYTLFHVFIPTDMRRPQFLDILEKYKNDFSLNSPEGMLVKLLGGWEGYIWTASDLNESWEKYARQRDRKSGLNFGGLLDAAMLLSWAETCRNEGETSQALELISKAVTELPGNVRLLKFEADLNALEENDLPKIDWWIILFSSFR